MKQKLLYIFLILLVIMNVALLFMLIKKPHKQPRPSRNFLAKELQFDEDQIERFRFLDQEHRHFMRRFDDDIKRSKDFLFNSFSKPNFSSDSIIKKIGILEAEKEQEVFTFFKQVRKLCTEEQAKKFDKVIKNALHKQRRRPPGRRGNRPPR